MTHTQRCSSSPGAEDGLRRKRICRSCGHDWTTTEWSDHWDARDQRWLSHPKPELPSLPSRSTPPPEPPPTAARSRKPSAFWPVTMEQAADHLLGIPPEVCSDILEWWNNSRRSKHGTGAAWTAAAFKGSAERVKKLAYWQQVVLTKAGIEAGWQKLDPRFCADQLKSQQQKGVGFQPASAGLAGALQILQGGGHGSG